MVDANPAYCEWHGCVDEIYTARIGATMFPVENPHSPEWMEIPISLFPLEQQRIICLGAVFRLVVDPEHVPVVRAELFSK